MDPRQQAAATLCEMARRRATTRQVWDGPRAGAETALVLGVLRRRGTLDAILAAHSSRKLPLIKIEALAPMRVGLFELLYMDGAPQWAVINAAVESTKLAGRFKDAGFVNAVLRTIMRGSKRVPLDADPIARRTLPRDDLAILFDKMVFPDPNQKPVEFLAARGSTAPWIAKRRLAELGFDGALACLERQASTPPTYLRVAPGRMDDVRAALPDAIDGPLPGTLEASPGARASDIFEAAGAWLVIQDSVAGRVAPYLAPAEGARVLDYCAAPGGKATHLAELVGPGGAVDAWDKDEERLALVAENAARLGLAHLRCTAPSGEYDGVLVDAPCSNTGVLARRPEARWRVRERHLPGMAERQLKILKDAAAFARPGGTVVYSTCSVEPEENQGVVEAFTAAGTFALEDMATIYPGPESADGGFMARLRRL